MQKKKTNARECTSVRLSRYRRWDNGERALIYYGRVERRIRSMFCSTDWKQLGIAAQVTEGQLDCYSGCLFYPNYWGTMGGVALVSWKYDFNNNVSIPLAVGECNLLKLLARASRLRLEARSETERAEMNELAEIITGGEVWLMNYYGDHFGVSRDLDKPYHGERQAMQPVAVDPWTSCGMTIPFHSKNRALHHSLIRVEVPSGTLLLPTTHYSSAYNPTLFCMMPEMPDSPVLYDSDAIAGHPEAAIILSDEIGVPLVNDSDDNHIFSTWYGGLEVVEHLDFELMHGHRIFWLCFDDGVVANPTEKYKKALLVADVFRKHEMDMRFLVFDQTQWTPNTYGMETGSYNNLREFSQTEFMIEASRYGVGERTNDETHAMTMDELIKIPNREFVLYPVLKEGFYCLIYGGSGVAKTWFALHVAIAISQGVAPFNKWEFRGRPMNVLYVAGEMEVGVYGERIKKLLAGQCTNLRFRLVREDLDLTTEGDQAKVADFIRECTSRVVVFDNLSTLAANGHTEGQFEKILKFFKRLQQKGIIVLLIHHENREGGFKGSGKIELVADQSLHLFSTGKGDKIELLVKAEKIRMTSRSEQGAFRTEFDLENPQTIWPVFPLTEEERHRLEEDDPLDEVGQNVSKKRNNQQRAWAYLDDDERAEAIINDMLSGCPDDVIAANLAVRLCVVSEFKKQHGIDEDALKRHLHDAKILANRDKGKTTPEALAPKLWERLKANTAPL